MKQLAKRLLPPLLVDLVRQRGTGRTPVTYAGDYATWAEASRDCTGYANPVILERTRAALLKVKRGEAAFERDGLLLAEPELPLPLLAGLFRAAAENSGRLTVLDFGGSLGSTYFQCRSFLAPLQQLRWQVVEQPAHVACGQQEFSGEELQFFPTIAAAVAAARPDVLLLSSVLAYVPAPYELLSEVLSHGFSWIMLDRTGFHRPARDRLTVQRVPEWIYPASYPAWFLSEPRLLAALAPTYDCLARFPARDEPELDAGAAYSQGMIFKHRP